jgi:hypothetical protein
MSAKQESENSSRMAGFLRKRGEETISFKNLIWRTLIFMEEKVSGDRQIIVALAQQ